MRWLTLMFLTSPLMAAATPLYNDYPDLESVENEFNNAYDSLQSRQMTVFYTTPTIMDLQDGEPAVYASTTNAPVVINMLLRVGATIYVSPNWNKVTGR